MVGRSSHQARKKILYSTIFHSIFCSFWYTWALKLRYMFYSGISRWESTRARGGCTQKWWIQVWWWMFKWIIQYYSECTVKGWTLMSLNMYWTLYSQLSYVTEVVQDVLDIWGDGLGVLNNAKPDMNTGMHLAMQLAHDIQLIVIYGFHWCRYTKGWCHHA